MMTTALTILSIVAAGFSMTFIAMRLVQQHDQPQANTADLVRPIAITDDDETAEFLRRMRRSPDLTPWLGLLR